MNIVAPVWAFLRTQTFVEGVWRLSLVLLPWQTRVFFEAQTLGIVPWEQGRPSFYLSMGAMWLLVGLIANKHRPWMNWKKRQIVWGVLAGMVLAFPTLSLIATGQWLLQVVTLVLWVWALQYVGTPRKQAAWLLFVLLPSAAFGVVQVFWQQVPASTLLGVAGQDPAQLGVSVIQVGAERVLRAYGSFSHPNIFGGWMVLATLLAWYLAQRNGRWYPAVGLSALALALSYSRSAWGAALIGGLFLGVMAWQSATLKPWVKGGMLIATVGVVVFGLAPERVTTRFQTETRLEQQSVQQRSASASEAVDVLRAYPLGTGLGAYRLGLVRCVCVADTACAVAGEPPHIVPLLALVELGLIRAMILGFCLLALCWQRRRELVGLAVVIVPVAFVSVLDHYFWSFWAGQALAAVAVLLMGFWATNKPVDSPSRGG